MSEWLNGIEVTIDRSETFFKKVYYRWAVYLFTEVVKQSPQWSGNFAANWVFDRGVGAPTYKYRAFNKDYSGGFVPGTGKWRGDPEAVAEAFRRNRYELQNITGARLTESITFQNNTPYAHAIAINRSWEEYLPFLRAGNYVDPTPIPLAGAMAFADIFLAQAINDIENGL